MSTTPSGTDVRVRFAPSPTGYLHVGGARTALFNWLYARHTGGKFLIRIEDTDLERSTPESVQQIIDSLEWLGMAPDEPMVYQTQRAEQHKEYVQQLLASGHAYHDYCPKEKLDELREQAKTEKRAFVYRRSLLTDAEVEQFKNSGEPGVIRMSSPETGTTGYDDLVYGRIEAPNETIGDFVIARADGSALYNFSNAVDDIDMGITHVCRGEDHVSNTLRQVLVYQGLGKPMPKFAHLPLILGTDKKRFSKRHGATSVMQFKDDGILPQALLNFLALLGWSPESADGEIEEVMTIEELIGKFTLEKVNKSAAVFDYEKLHWMNGMHIRRLPKEEIYAAVVPELDLAFGATGGPGDEEPGRAQWLRNIIDLEIERSRTMKDFAVNLDYFFQAPTSYEEKPLKKLLSTREQIEMFRQVAKEIEGAWPANAHTRDEVHDVLDAHLRGWCEAQGVKFGNAVHPVRLALTGRTASPPLFDVIYNVGKDDVLARLEALAVFAEGQIAE